MAGEEALEEPGPFVRTGDRYFDVQNLRLLSELALDRDDPLTAAAFARESLAGAQAIDSDILVIEAHNALVDALVRGGLVDEACDVAAAAREALPADDAGALGVVLQLEATAAAARGDAATARTAARSLVELTDKHGRALARVVARLDLARVLEQVGPAESAAEALAEARALAEEADEPSLVGAVDLASKRHRSVPAS